MYVMFKNKIKKKIKKLVFDTFDYKKKIIETHTYTHTRERRQYFIQISKDFFFK